MELSRRQLLKGGLASLFAGKIELPTLLPPQIEPTQALRPMEFDPFGTEMSDVLIKMIVELMDDINNEGGAMWLRAYGKNASHPAQPASDAPDMLEEAFPGEAVDSTDGRFIVKVSPPTRIADIAQSDSDEMARAEHVDDLVARNPFEFPALIEETEANNSVTREPIHP